MAEHAEIWAAENVGRQTTVIEHDRPGPSQDGPGAERHDGRLGLGGHLAVSATAAEPVVHVWRTTPLRTVTSATLAPSRTSNTAL